MIRYDCSIAFISRVSRYIPYLGSWEKIVHSMSNLSHLCKTAFYETELTDRSEATDG